MGTKGSAGQRAKKKHEKAQKRKKAVAKKQAARTAAAGRPASPPLRSSMKVLEEEGISGLGGHIPYFDTALALALDHDEHDLPLPPLVWTPTRMERLDTSEIQRRLGQLGIHTDPTAFADATAGSFSAVEHATSAWIPLLPAESDAHARDFARLAACELWKRWRPEVPSQELLAELVMRQVFDDNHGRVAEAIERGQRFWRLLQKALTPDIRTCEAAEALLGRPGLIRNWAPDFAITAHPAAHDDPEVGRLAAATLAEVLARFPAEPDGWTLPLIYDHAELIYESGSREEGERILRDRIAARPDHAGAYVTLATLWAEDGKEHQALHLLEEAAARPVKDGDEWDLAGRIEELREAMGVPAP